MLITPKRRAPLAIRIGFLLVVPAFVALTMILAACRDHGATPPPPTIIRADAPPTLEGPTATPTPTATPGEGYPAPAPTTPPVEPGYPSQEITPSPAAAYPGR